MVAAAVEKEEGERKREDEREGERKRGDERVDEAEEEKAEAKTIAAEVLARNRRRSPNGLSIPHPTKRPLKGPLALRASFGPDVGAD